VLVRPPNVCLASADLLLDWSLQSCFAALCKELECFELRRLQANSGLSRLSSKVGRVSGQVLLRAAVVLR
jgi:hypothetical protein